MNGQHPYWAGWARFLQLRGLGNLAAFFLDAGGPFKILAAQLIYMGQPFMRSSLPEGHLQALADILEDQELAKEFAAVLREETSL